jgi:glutathione S-transferase
MRLYWGKGTCAIGIHILLEEAGLTYDTEQIDVGGGATRQPLFLALNPKGKVPTLVRDDGSVLTEFSAIATWIARQAPERSLLPEDPDSEARSVEVMAYVEGTIHGQGYARLFVPERFDAYDETRSTLGSALDDVKRNGREIVEKGFGLLDLALAANAYAAGERFTIADAALFYVERWAPKQGIELPPRIARHYEQMLARPAVAHVRKLWGEA